MAPTIRHVFMDLDYTTLDYGSAHRAAIDVFAKSVSEEFAEAFDGCFQILHWGGQVQNDDWSAVPGGEAGYVDLRHRLHTLQAGGHPFPWSREIMALYAAQKAGLHLDPQEAEKFADAYWSILSSKARLYPDAFKLLGNMRMYDVCYHITTGSDSCLRWKDAHWKYDPELSKQRKHERIAPLRECGFLPTSVTTGDPIDKPLPEFYTQAMLRACIAITGNIDPKECITVGDSYSGDVAMPMGHLGIPQGYWLQRGESTRQLLPTQQTKSNVVIINSLEEIPLR